MFLPFSKAFNVRDSKCFLVEESKADFLMCSGRIHCVQEESLVCEIQDEMSFEKKYYVRNL